MNLFKTDWVPFMGFAFQGLYNKVTTSKFKNSITERYSNLRHQCVRSQRPCFAVRIGVFIILLLLFVVTSPAYTQSNLTGKNYLLQQYILQIASKYNTYKIFLPNTFDRKHLPCEWSMISVKRTNGKLTALFQTDHQTQKFW